MMCDKHILVIDEQAKDTKRVGIPPSLTVGELEPRLFFLLAWSGSRFRFDVGQLLWFQSTWKKKQRAHLISEVFSARPEEESNVTLRRTK